MGKRITIDDIAKKLNISRSLVSKALNDSYGVNVQTKTRIRYTALEMGYDFQKIKRNRAVQTGEIGVLIGNINSLAAEDFYFNLLEALDKECAERELALSTHLLSEFTAGSLENASRSSLKLRGHLLLCGSPKDAVVIASYGIPFVAVDFLRSSPRVNRVGVDYYQGGCDAVAHFLQCGHTKIGFVGAAVVSNNFNVLYNGYCHAMRQAGLTDFEKYCSLGAPENVGSVPLDEAAVYAILQDEDPPTALLCATDTVAARLYGICAEMGIRIPEDLSVIGFDNQPICKQLSPALTSVDYDVDQVARHAVSILETAMRYPNASTCAITVDTRVIKRDSVQKPKDPD
ncbi:MAG: LacI family DNA-binding transcriptional regulator [Clostridia bacterium]|nr:LacI family DNA-binding transcriptional regulator [Clostridia bacterium]